MATLTLKITDIPEHHPLATLAHEADLAAVKWPDLPGAAMSVETLRRMLYPQARVLRGPLLPDSPTATPSAEPRDIKAAIRTAEAHQDPCALGHE